jgi:F-type H+-transporting ATPase subunit epsilon
MVKLIVVTPKGELINEDFQIVVAKGDQGEIGILENRLPIIVKISDGYVRAESDKKTVYVYVISGILDNVNSTVTIVAEEATLGDSIENAKANLMQRREDVKAYNRKTKIDSVQAEKDLAKHIKESKASQV